MSDEKEQRQSNKTEVKPEQPTATPGAATSVEHVAPEDHYTSGGQHQEQKEALKKSVEEKQPQPPAGQNPGQHSTGSFTGTTGGPGPQTTGGRSQKKP
ncbi:MAG TPA: hypothetical protein VGM02_08665 [Acidobacteriaceae bacterium]|jgi:hypothetical protein